ncbi:unnamed protein product, partial [Pleuronectes platessa]
MVPGPDNGRVGGTGAAILPLADATGESYPSEVGLPRERQAPRYVQPPLIEQYYPTLDVGALGRRFWLRGLQREGLGFIFQQVQAKGRAAKYSFRSQHFLLFLRWLGRRQASLKHHKAGGTTRAGVLRRPPFVSGTGTVMRSKNSQPEQQHEQNTSSMREDVRVRRPVCVSVPLA